MWMFTCVHRHVNWDYHYWHWVLFRQTYCWDWWMPFPYYVQGTQSINGVLGIWFLQSFPLPWLFLSLGFKGCISDLYALVIPSLHFRHVCISVMVVICCQKKKKKGASLMMGESLLICAYEGRYSENSYDVGLWAQWLLSCRSLTRFTLLGTISLLLWGLCV